MKKILIFILCFIFVFQFAACGVNEGGSNSVGTESISDFSDFVENMESSVGAPEVSFIDISTDENSKTDESLPQTSQPEESLPEASEPEVSEPEVSEPEASEPEVSEPEVSEPEVSKPEVSKPEVSELEVSEPEVSEPEVSEPEVSEPEVSEPDISKPEYDYTTGQTHVSLKNTERYLFSILTPQQKEWYLKIDAAVKNFESDVALDADIIEDENYYIYYLYMADNPEHFYLGNEIGVYSDGVSQHGLYLTYSDGKTHSGHEYGDMTDELKNSLRAKKDSFDKEVKRIVSTIPAEAPDVVKEKLIYDYILSNAVYATDHVWDGPAPDLWTAYGVLMNGIGVCESYAEAFQLLCLSVGINCVGVDGDAGGKHKWNAVCIENEWYMCDITFDDPIGGPEGAAYHRYFNLTTAQMQSKNHTIDQSHWQVPVCNGTKYSFDNYFGE